MGVLFDYLALLTLGTGPAIFVAVAGVWSQCTFRSRQRNPTYRTVFSIAAVAVAIQIAGAIYVGLGGRPRAWDASTALVPFVTAVTVFFVLNSGFVAGAISVATNRPLARLWSETFLSTWPGYLLGATVAVASVSAIGREGLWLVLLLTLPFALTFYYLSAYLERVDEASNDSLTGLPNLRFALAHLTRELARAKRHRGSLVIVVADLDGFKWINDTHGHRAGDRVLCRVAQCLRGSLRSHDVCARYGGDEFLIVLSDCGPAQGQARAHELQTAVSALGMDVRPGMNVSLAISVGCAAYPDEGQLLEELLEVADARMYRDKLSRGARRSRLPIQ
jgi:diguanylate cyclase (GGDEF)-like protein